MKTVHCLLLPLLGAGLLTACSATPQERFADAQKAFASRDYTAARLHLTSALGEVPGDARMLSLLVHTHLELGDGEGASSALQQLEKLGKLPQDHALLRGEAALLKAQFQDALAQVEPLNSAPAYRVRALAHIGLGNGADAATAFAKGVGAEGDKARLYADYSRFTLGLGDKVSARKWAGQAVAAEPEQIDALLALGAVAAQQGQLAEALTAYDKALRLYPRNRAALIGKAAVLGDLGRYAEMEPLMKLAQDDVPRDADISYLLARSAAGQKEWTKVRTILQKVEGDLRNRPDAQILYAQSLLRSGQAELALARLGPVVRSYPGHRLARRLLAESQLAAGDAAAARATLKPLSDRPGATIAELALAAKAARAAGDPDAASLAVRARFPTPEALATELGNADAALRAKNWKAAIRSYERILAVTDGKNVLVLNNMAYAQSQAGNKPLALDYAMKALALAPDNPSVLDTAGWLIFETGKDQDRALSLLAKAARLAPGNASIAGHLAQVRGG